VEECLSGQNTYTLHKPVRKNVPRNSYTVTNIDDMWEMKFADLSSLSKYNDKCKYLSNVTDIFSPYACCVSLKDKTGTLIKSAFKFLFQNKKSITIQSHKGTYIVNANVQEYLKCQIVHFHTTQKPDIKGDVIERFNKSLKTRM